jgi:hypothetical protein
MEQVMTENTKTRTLDALKDEALSCGNLALAKPDKGLLNYYLSSVKLRTDIHQPWHLSFVKKEKETNK